jgi:hypothetical protein
MHLALTFKLSTSHADTTTRAMAIRDLPKSPRPWPRPQRQCPINLERKGFPVDVGSLIGIFSGVTLIVAAILVGGSVHNFVLFNFSVKGRIDCL